MKYVYLLIVLSLTACDFHSNDKQRKTVSLSDSVAPADNAGSPPPAGKNTAADSSAGVSMASNALFGYLARQQWDTAFEKKLSLSSQQEESRGARNVLITTTSLKSDSFNIVSISGTGGDPFDCKGEIKINGKQITKYFTENGDSINGKELDATTISDAYTFKSSQYHYLLLITSADCATGKFREIGTGILVNLDRQPYTARIFFTWKDLDNFYFTPDGNTGKLKYITVDPLDANGEIVDGDDQQILVHVSALNEP
ncbi:hypothetical protein FHW36_102429 [Chitinophaga polysaccharea]|uniref:Lipoprotein n=1 Tax=Chitinophaga polysaccharea TaxID=1293035 RepID=A0A561PX40_9BACT|nr:hypothetical protein [Chitinophaga polysaccharea]TWF42668.1 hypothetical protein FHW36_102429 [Chitinophaga polysaccharea]